MRGVLPFADKALVDAVSVMVDPVGASKRHLLAAGRETHKDRSQTPREDGFGTAC